jgi:hypothetical protein
LELCLPKKCNFFILILGLKPFKKVFGNLYQIGHAKILNNKNENIMKCIAKVITEYNRRPKYKNSPNIIEIKYLSHDFIDDILNAILKHDSNFSPFYNQRYLPYSKFYFNEKKTFFN